MPFLLSFSNMKKLNFLIIATFAFCSMQANAQRKLPADRLIIDTTGILPPEPPDYYSGKTTISGIGFAFKKARESYSDCCLIMQNVNNVKFGTSPYLYLPPPINGEEQLPGDIRLFARFNNRNQVLNSVKDAFGTAVINQFKSANNEAVINIIFAVNMNGTVAEVQFLLEKNPLLFSIPPEKFYYMETLLKQRVTFTVRQIAYLKYIPDVVVHVKIKDL